MTDENDVKIKELELQEKDIANSQAMFQNVINEMSVSTKIKYIIFTKIFFTLLCFLVIAFLIYFNDKLDHDDRFSILIFALLSILAWSDAIAEKHLLHDLFKAIISVIISIINAPSKVLNQVGNYLQKK